MATQVHINDRKSLVRGWKPPCLIEIGYSDLEIHGPEGETTFTVALFDFKKNNCDVCANKMCQWPQATPEVLIAI
jgi:hypothetical protein